MAFTYLAAGAKPAGAQSTSGEDRGYIEGKGGRPAAPESNLNLLPEITRRVKVVIRERKPAWTVKH